ncbi:hypothetical protein [Nocardioides sp.]|uniref:hypothetical protein n=1 Tax=Nocardioides sp. TaxID=35761 RepID=UPI0035167605
MTALDARLDQPLDLPCGLRLPNRLAKAALSEALADGGNDPDERLVTLCAGSQPP